MVYDRGVTSSATTYYHVHSSSTSSQSSRYIGNSSSPWVSGSSSMVQHQKPKIKLQYVSPLDISLKYFIADEVENEKVSIQWETLRETNNAYFNVLRSYNGNEWTSIHEVAGKGTSLTGGSYRFIDDKLSETVAYYKLKQTDFDGKSEEFGPVVVNLRKNNFEIYPNPSKGLFTIEFQSNKVDDVELTIEDGLGRVALSKSLLAENGLNKLNVDCSNFSKGIYFIQVKFNDTILSKKVSID